MNEHDNKNFQKHSYVIHCESLARGFAEKHIDFDSYAENITSSIIDCEEQYWPKCLNTIPPSSFHSYKEYLNVAVKQVDYKPEPWAFLFGDETPAEIEQRKLDFRPKYVALVSLVEQMSP